MSSKKNSVEISEGWSRSLGPAFCMEKQTLGQRDIHALPKPVRLFMLCATQTKKAMFLWSVVFIRFTLSENVLLKF
jgi:hypothetical protein